MAKKMSREEWDALPAEKREAIVAMIQQTNPAMTMGLNVAQYRAIEACYSGFEGGLVPSIAIVAFGNGVGKTHLLVLDMIGWTKGADFLRFRAFPPIVVDFYRGLAALRDKGLLSLRLACASDDMKAGGSCHQIIKELIPDANFTARDTGGCFRQIDIPHPTILRIKNSIAIKTFDQEEIKHSGSTCNRIWINEPIPSNLIGETVSRIRSKKGNSEGSIMMAATMLDHAGWVTELEDDPKNRVVQCKGHLYENCVGEDVTDEMADEIQRATGQRPQKAPNSDSGYITNGVLTKSSIDSMVNIWQKTTPLEVEARKSGSYMSGGGKILPGFNKDVHIVKRDIWIHVPKEFPVTQVVDPHPGKDDFSVWYLDTPQNRTYALFEWPTMAEYGPYDMMNHKHHTIKETCEIWRAMEAEKGISKNMVRRVGDPNRFKEPNPRDNSILLSDYANYGFHFEINVSDNLDVGHRRMNEFLWYDINLHRQNPRDPMGWPRFFISEECENLIRCIQHYSTKASRDPETSLTDKIIQKWKDPVDTFRYKVMSFIPFDEIRISNRRVSDFDRFSAARSKVGNSNPFAGMNLKGRTLVSSERRHF